MHMQAMTNIFPREYPTLICAIFTALALGGSSAAQTRHDVFIHVGSADSLDATYFVPAKTPPQAGFPAVLFIHGFGTSKDTKVPSCSLYAASGYLTMAYTVRGHGRSSGLSTIMAQQERQDFGEVFSYLKHLTGVDTASIGVVGSSQGGLHGLWAAADGLGVAAVVADVIVPAWATDMLMNGSIRRTLLLLLKTIPSTVRYDPVSDSLWALARTDAYDSLRSQFARGRDVDTAALTSSPTPMLTFVKWQDHYFNPAGGIELFQMQTAPKKLYAGTQGHWSDESPQEAAYQSDQTTRWLKNFLQRQPTGILDEPPVTYAASSLPMDSAGYFTWTRTQVPEWPPAGVHPVQLYLGPDSALLFVPPAQPGSFLLRNDYLNSAYSFDTGYVEGFKGVRFDAVLPQKTFAFMSGPLPPGVTWIGVPRMSLRVQSADEKFPLHVQIYEVDSLGRKYFINRINYTARHWHAGSTLTVEAEGIPHAHHFTGGSRIRIEITNIDRTNRIQPGPYPFVVPIFANAGATISWDAANPSYVEIPMIGSPNGVLLLSRDVPRGERLFQNYPNPFNAATDIRFETSHKSVVSLTIYTVLGQEVQKLLSAELGAGSHMARWDARGCASGVYYYELRVGESRVVKKMILAR
jgi:predicted acyl esterase